VCLRIVEILVSNERGICYANGSIFVSIFLVNRLVEEILPGSRYGLPLYSIEVFYGKDELTDLAFAFGISFFYVNAEEAYANVNYPRKKLL
jgi:hypothetical protein